MHRELAHHSLDGFLREGDARPREELETRQQVDELRLGDVGADGLDGSAGGGDDLMANAVGGDETNFERRARCGAQRATKGHPERHRSLSQEREGRQQTPSRPSRTNFRESRSARCTNYCALLRAITLSYGHSN